MGTRAEHPHFAVNRPPVNRGSQSQRELESRAGPPCVRFHVVAHSCTFALSDFQTQRQKKVTSLPQSRVRSSESSHTVDLVGGAHNSKWRTSFSHLSPELPSLLLTVRASIDWKEPLCTGMIR
jgi:hypothetical protein